MKKRNTVCMLLAVCSVMCLAAACQTSQNSGDGSNINSSTPTPETERPTNEVELVSSSIYNRYYTGDSVTVKNAQLSYSGSLESERFEIIKPDGSVSTDAELTFSTAGTYTVKYYLELYLENIYATQTITVTDWAEEYANISMVEMSGKTVSYIGNSFKAADTATLNYYGTSVEGSFTSITAPDGTVITEQTAKLTQGGVYKVNYDVEIGGRTFTAAGEVSTDYTCYEVDGENSAVDYGFDKISLDLAEGDEFIVNRVVDLSQMSVDDTLFAFRLNPENVNNGLPDAMIISVKLTDIYDSTNYVTIQINKRWDQVEYRSWADPLSYSYAACAEQTMGGISLDTGKNTSAGRSENFSMVGSPAGQTLTFRFDYEQRQVYANGGMVQDLDDPKYFDGTGEFEKVLWNGFTTGEAYLSVYAEDYRNKSKQVHMEIVDIAGFGLTNDKAAEFETAESLEYCEVNDSASLTAKNLVFNGKTYATESVLIVEPDGTEIEKSVAESYTFAKAGTYKLYYFATDDDGSKMYASRTVVAEKIEVKLAKTLRKEYKVGTSLTLPAATIIARGETHSANVEVIAPDGTKTSGSAVTLSQLGTYTARYYNDQVNCEKLVTFNVLETVIYAAGTKAGTVVDTNAAIPGGWDSKMFGVTVAAGDTVTVNDVADWTDKTSSSNYFAYQMAFDKMTAAEYQGTDFTITFTNVDNAEEYLAFKHTCAEDNQVIVTVIYNGEQIWSNPIGKYMGNDMVDVWGRLLTVNVYEGGCAVAGAHMVLENFFTQAIVTISSESGSSAAFSYLADARNWQDA